MLPKDPVWFITGCSKGLGHAIAQQALARGHKVVATARRRNDLEDIVRTGGDAVLPLQLDVTEQGAIEKAVTQAERHFGRIDVLVNNAGYGLIGAIEEVDAEEMKQLFETDYFAPVALIKQVLPGMRSRGQGHIVNISSIGGIVSYPGVGSYNAVKAAVEAMSDALAQEVSGLGIGVTVVAPGTFRTDFRSSSSIRMAALEIADYANTAGKARSGIPAGHGKQNGDPVRGARAIVEAVTSGKAPVHLLIGGDALDQLRSKLDAMRSETDAWEALSRSTDFQDR